MSKRKPPEKFTASELHFAFIADDYDGQGDGYIWIGKDGHYVGDIHQTPHVEKLRKWCEQVIKARGKKCKP